MQRLTALLLTIALGACGAAQTQTDARAKAIDVQLAQLRDVSEAQNRRVESMKDRIALLEDRLEARAIHSRRDPAAAGIPPGLPTLRLTRSPAREERAKVVARAERGPVTSITQREMDALDSRRRPARGGPRTPVRPPDNAAGAGNIGVLPLPGARERARPRRGISPAPPPAPPIEAGPIAAYKAATAKKKAGDLVGAIRAYRDFGARYPSHDYADNALYGLGKCRYDRAEFAGALKAFQRVVRDYATGNMTPEALFMVGLTLRKLGRPAEGRETLSRLATMYPKTRAGQRAAVEMNARHR